MLVYIIDGCNLIHKVPSLKKSASAHAHLIGYIKKNKLTGSKNNKVIIVFDGEPYSLPHYDFEVIYSHQMTADEIIKRKVQKLENKRQVIVVSDDREIQDFARSQGAHTQKITEFVKAKKSGKRKEDEKAISYTLAHQITEEMRKIWLKE
ncbi:MAG: NYN domain-containing protein [Candidatus Omnitrophota bacterium]|nr:MAG: NYN domain-containing protein [Candidatus Omnitrophota bacterium]